MLARVRRTLTERKLVARGSRVLVACSGGPDSVALAHALSVLGPELAFDVEIASVDHGLRAEAPEEVLSVERLARALSVPFTPIRIEVPRRSLQASARDARYRALAKIAWERRCDRVATGHTRDDQAETLLDRMLRGSGIVGLAGVQPARADGVIRPLLDCARTDVLAYVARHALGVVDDPSNRDLAYRRVRIRTDLLPRLEAENPQAKVHLARLADEARELGELLEALVDARVRALGLDDPLPDPLALEVQMLASEPVAVRRALLRRLAERFVGRPIGRSHVEDMETIVSRDGDVWLPRGVVATREGSSLVLRRSMQR